MFFSSVNNRSSKINKTAKIRIPYATYYAWSPKQILVCFDLDGGTYLGLESVDHFTVTFDSHYGNLPLPEKEGYAFVGWYYSGVEITSVTKVTMNGEHVLKAEWIMR